MASLKYFAINLDSRERKEEKVKRKNEKKNPPTCNKKNQTTAEN